MANGFFITGTDTGVGKTVVSESLIRHFIAKGERVIGMKPVASGAHGVDGNLRNEDAISLINASNVSADYAQINPYCFAEPIAPHIAAEKSGTTISVTQILKCYRELAGKSDRVIVEGVGGWEVPIDPATTMADVALQLQLPVIMVVGLRLGCINHALLTAQSITSKGCRLIGWIANQIDPGMSSIQENVHAIETRLKRPLLAQVPYAIERPLNAFIAFQHVHE